MDGRAGGRAGGRTGSEGVRREVLHRRPDRRSSTGHSSRVTVRSDSVLASSDRSRRVISRFDRPLVATDRSLRVPARPCYLIAANATTARSKRTGARTTSACPMRSSNRSGPENGEGPSALGGSEDRTTARHEPPSETNGAPYAVYLHVRNEAEDPHFGRLLVNERSLVTAIPTVLDPLIEPIGPGKPLFGHPLDATGISNAVRCDGRRAISSRGPCASAKASRGRPERGAPLG
ncbi:m107 protein [Murid betaherpesvirus 1]|nr:m107 protein [Murid betaherpesvirus 1]